MCVYICTHTHIYIYIYIWGNLKFLPVSWSEGLPKPLMLCLWWSRMLALWCSAVLPRHLQPPQGVSVQKQGRTGLDLSWGPGRDKACGFVPSPICRQPRSVPQRPRPSPRGTCVLGTIELPRAGSVVSEEASSSRVLRPARTCPCCPALLPAAARGRERGRRPTGSTPTGSSCPALPNGLRPSRRERTPGRLPSQRWSHVVCRSAFSRDGKQASVLCAS